MTPGTDAALARWRDLELGEKRRAELAPVHRRTDRVEVAEPVEDAFDLLVSGTLGVVEMLEGAAPDPPLDLLAAPSRPLAARAGWRPADRASTAARSTNVASASASAAFLAAAFVRGVLAAPFARGVGTQAWCPVIVADNARGAADPLPGRGVEQFAVGAAGGHVGEEVEQVAAAQPTPVDVEQVEHEPWHEAFDQTAFRADRSTRSRRRRGGARRVGRTVARPTTGRPSAPNGVPARPASSTALTASRTSSSASVVEITSTADGWPVA